MLHFKWWSWWTMLKWGRHERRWAGEERQTHKHNKNENITIVLIEIRAYAAYTLIIIIFIPRLLYSFGYGNAYLLPFVRSLARSYKSLTLIYACVLCVYINIIIYKNVNVSILFGLYQDKMTKGKKDEPTVIKPWTTNDMAKWTHMHSHHTIQCHT